MWDYNELINHFKSMGDKYVSETSTEHHEIHTFGHNGETGNIFIPQFNSKEPFGYSFSSSNFEQVNESDTPTWFRDLVTKTKEIMKIKS